MTLLIIFMIVAILLLGVEVWNLNIQVKYLLGLTKSMDEREQARLREKRYE